MPIFLRNIDILILTFFLFYRCFNITVLLDLRHNASSWPSATKNRLFDHRREMGMARCWYLRFSGRQCRPRSPSLSGRGIDVSTRVSVTPRRGNSPPRERVVRATLHPRYTGWPRSRQCHKSRQFSSRSFVETRREQKEYSSPYCIDSLFFFHSCATLSKCTLT